MKTVLGFFFAFALILVISLQAHSTQLLRQPIHANVAPPKALTLCGEQMPLERRAVWEVLDEELTIAVHNHAQVLMWLKRAGRYFSYLEKKLDGAGMPDDLKYLAVAESSLRPNIRSREGALGLWQFIPETASRYKLKRNRSMDERRSLESSTEAALKYLKELRGIFNSWALAMAAYNCGEDRLQKEIKEQRINDYYSLNLPKETERFIFRVAAIKLIMENPEHYGYSLPRESIYMPRQFDSVNIQIEKPIHITEFAEAIQTNFKIIKELNPKIKGYYLPVGQYMLNIPAGKKNVTAKALHQLSLENASRSEKRDSSTYWVQHSETLSHISQPAGISIAELERQITKTPIKFKETKAVAVKKEEISLTNEINEFLMNWKIAWENTAGPNGDFETYMSFYASEFSVRGLDKSGWEQDKAQKNKRKDWIRIGLKNIDIVRKIGNNSVEVSFFQDFQSSNYSAVSDKTLMLKKEESGWKIIGIKRVSGLNR